MRFPMLLLGLTLAALAAPSPAIARAAWPPWLSIEAPVNPFDPSTRGAVMLVHVRLREGAAKLSELGGTAEGIVHGQRRSVRLRFDGTSLPGVFALRRQWPEEGTWLVQVTFAHTTAIVTLDGEGNLASVRVPTRPSRGYPIPRPVGAAEIDSVLAIAARP
jgi:hypothetical protein